MLRNLFPMKRKEVLPGFRPRRVIWIRQDRRLGNLLLSLPALGAVKQLAPGTHTAMLVSSQYSSLVEFDPRIDELFVFDHAEWYQRPWKVISLLKTLRRKRFDLAVDCTTSNSASLSNGMWSRLCGARLTMGYERDNSECFLSYPIPFPQGDWHEADLQLHLLEPVFGGKPAGIMKVFFPPDADRIALGVWQKVGLSPFKRTIGIHIGGRGRKAYPDAQLVGFLNLMSTEDLQCVVLAGRAESGRSSRIRTRVKGIWFAPMMSLLELAVFISRCDAFVAPDCGALHLALSVRVPTVAIFSGSDAKRFGPRGAHARVVGGDGHVPSPEQVKSALKDLLASERGAHS